ncbi:805_t:CDS:2, partial [Paraglomus occultum]
MRLAKRKIILLMDNARCHEVDLTEDLSNVRVHFLPLNTTSVLQPLDQGIIYSFKAQYRKILCKEKILAYERLSNENDDLPQITIYDAIQFVARAWENVTQRTICHSWERSGILPLHQLNDNEEQGGDSNNCDEEQQLENDLTNYFFTSLFLIR